MESVAWRIILRERADAPGEAWQLERGSFKTIRHDTLSSMSQAEPRSLSPTGIVRLSNTQVSMSTIRVCNRPHGVPSPVRRGSASTGRLKQKVLPPPILCSTQIRPP